MAFKKRATQEFEDAPTNIGLQSAVLGSLSGGYNGYTDPEILSPQFWAQASNVYSGQFGAIRRARFAPIVNSSTSGYTPQGSRFTSLYSFRDPTPQDILLGDIGNTIWSFNVNGNYAASQITDGTLNLSSSSLFTGPWSRQTMGGIAYGMNNQIKRHFRGAGGTITENWGLDSPDTAPQFQFTQNGPNAGSAENDLGNNGHAWTTPANVFTTAGITGTYAQASATSSLPTNTLQLTGFGFSVPVGTVVTGMQASVFYTKLAGGFVQSSNVYFQLLKAGTPVGSFVAGRSLPGSLTGVGGNGFTFGQSILAADANNATFGFQFYVAGGPHTGTATWGVNGASITLFYLTGQGVGSITKTIGRSYSFAWENNVIFHVGAPSPAAPYIPETNGLNTIQCVEAGTVTTSNVSPVVTVNTATPSAAWVNRHLWIAGIGDAGRIISVNVAGGTVTLLNNPPSVQTAVQYQIFDPQATNIRLYATSDGGAVYFRIQRNAFVASATDVVSAGLQFTDNDNSEPPNGEFTSEIEQVNNLPPPIGNFVDQYGARLIVYGVPGAPQAFFYSNYETTSVGNVFDSFSPLNQVTLPMGDAQLFGTANLPTGFILWSNKQDMFKLTGLLTDNVVSTSTQLGATISRLPYRIGCATPYAVAITSLGVIWLSSDRQVWLFTDHYAPKNIGQPIQDILNSINGARLAFAKMRNYKQGDKNWLELSVATGTSTFNNKKLILDVSALSSNGQASFFTFDMATNQPTWYPYDVNCEAVEVTPDNTSTWHTLVGDVDMITETDWTPFQVTPSQPAYFTIGSEQANLSASVTQHALGNEAPHIIKTLEFMRCNTNQLPKNIAAQGWQWNVLSYDDDAFVLGVQANVTHLAPVKDSQASVITLENSPAVFRFGGVIFAKGRRFQFQTIFPTTPGFWEFRSFQIQYQNVCAR